MPHKTNFFFSNFFCPTGCNATACVRFGASQPCAASATAALTCAQGYVVRLAVPSASGGSLPTTLGELSALTALTVDGMLSGSIPRQIAQLTALQFVALRFNELVGNLSLPAGVIGCNLTSTCLDCPAVVPARCVCVRAPLCAPLLPTPSPPPVDKDNGLQPPALAPALPFYASTPFIAGVAAGGGCLLALVCVGVVCCFVRRKKRDVMHSLPLPSATHTELPSIVQPVGYASEYQHVSVGNDYASASQRTPSVGSSYHPLAVSPDHGYAQIEVGNPNGVNGYDGAVVLGGTGSFAPPPPAGEYGIMVAAGYQAAELRSGRFNEFTSARETTDYAGLPSNGSSVSSGYAPMQLMHQ